LEAEASTSLATNVREVFEDRQFAFSALTAAVATFICITSLVGMMRLAADVRPDSLAALIQSVPPPGSNENPVPIDAYVMMPWALDQAFSTAADTGADDSEFMITAVVTREGTVANLALHSATSQKAAENLMGAVSRARFEPARVDGLPVAVSMVWLVANTTVRASEATPLDRPVPPTPKRRVA
jgi:hypothetical protein